MNEESRLLPGQQVASFEVIQWIASGGMGDVYLAKDTRLGRKVALKLLPSNFTNDRDRVRRFAQEARSASALNHPNIVTIYDIGESDGVNFIATEYIEGESLHAYLKRRGRLRADEAVDIAAQITAALIAAHSAGIIHRDIKPENVIVRTDGILKVLDFGLAKLSKQASAGSEAPTQAIGDTEPGTVMGTLRYMSPEQARGLEVDQRTDIWSLGCILYEMLTGNPPFDGFTRSDVLVAVLDREPRRIGGPPGDVPETLEWVVVKALTKDREERYQTAKELMADLRRVKRQLDNAHSDGHQTVITSPLISANGPEIRPPNTDPQNGSTTPLPSGATNWSSRGFASAGGPKSNVRKAFIGTIAFLVCGVIAFAFYTLAFRRTTGDGNLNAGTRSAVRVVSTTQVSYSAGLDMSPSLSPDGNSVAYSSDQTGNFEIYVRQLAPGGREIQLTTDGQQNLQPAWSSDGRQIAYYSIKRGGIWIVPSLGGVAHQLTEFGSHPAWSPDSSMIAFASIVPSTALENPLAPSSIWTISAQGTNAKQVTPAGTPTGTHSAPAWSPDGRRLVFISETLSGSTLWSVSIDGSDLKDWTPKSAGVRSAVYSSDGKSIYFFGATRSEGLGLWEMKISPENAAVVGEPVLVSSPGASIFSNLSISSNGKKIAYALLNAKSNLWSVSTNPATGSAAAEPKPFTNDTSQRNNLPAWSPDGQKIAFCSWRGSRSADVWIVRADGSDPQQLTTDPANDAFPSWFPDGTRVAYISNRGGRTSIWSATVGGGKDSLLLEPTQNMEVATLSPDGKRLAFQSNAGGPINIWTIDINGQNAKQITFDKEMMGFPSWSPDGKWLALEAQRVAGSAIMVVPSNGGEPEQMTTEVGQSWPNSWARDNERIAFAGQRNGKWNIYWVSRKTKEQKQLTTYTKQSSFVRYPAWSPKGDQIIYEYGETTGNIWVADIAGG